MTHVRQQIREAFIAKLIAAAMPGAEIMKARTLKVDPVNGPIILVFAPTETSDVSAMGKIPPLEREVSISLEGYVKGGVDIEDDLDDIAEAVEQAFGADPKLGGLVKSTFLVSTNMDIGGGSEQRVANIQMAYKVRYRTMSHEPSTSIQ
ncbi:hypothetical protein [Maritalea sp.]|jgi:hypothetical protein|uniref:hypothetical protein n=1 Tax=Maritalea sp. TaxID=2003361 RepID=UPI0039E2E8C9